MVTHCPATALILIYLVAKDNKWERVSIIWAGLQGMKEARSMPEISCLEKSFVDRRSA